MNWRKEYSAQRATDIIGREVHFCSTCAPFGEFDMTGCFICGLDYQVVYLAPDAQPINRIIDNDAHEFVLCHMCIRKLFLGYVVGSVDTDRNKRTAIKYGIKKIKEDTTAENMIVQYFR